MKWEKSRICSFNYEILSGNEDGAYHIVTNDNPQIYYVMPFDGLTKNGNQTAAPFRTELCKGCSGFCTIANQTCQSTAATYNFDEQLKNIVCMPGFVYSDIYSVCLQCPINCLSCTLKGTILDCVKCNSGFAMYYNISKQDKMCYPCGKIFDC